MGRKSIVKKVTYGICGSLLDLMIWQITLVGASVGKTGSRGMYEAFREADETLQRVNHHTLAITWNRLTRKRLITYKKRNNLYYPKVTEFGRKRLFDTIPLYYSKRPWDKKIYLINYDIPETDHKKRDLLRLFLNNLHARLLQESTWLTPYNPRQLLNEFIREKEIPGVVLISDIGTDGGVGEMTIQDLLVRLYSLEKINERYEEFLENFREGNKQLQYLLFEYLSILKEDPQLPFELLPKGWLGDKAYGVYNKIKNKYILFFHGRE